MNLRTILFSPQPPQRRCRHQRKCVSGPPEEIKTQRGLSAGVATSKCSELFLSTEACCTISPSDKAISLGSPGKIFQGRKVRESFQ